MKINRSQLDLGSIQENSRTVKYFHWFFHINIIFLLILTSVTFISEDTIEGIGILILFTPILPIYVLIIAASIGFFIKSNNSFTKQVLKIFLLLNILYIALLALDVSNISDYLRDLSILLIRNWQFSAYLVIILSISILKLINQRPVLIKDRWFLVGLVYLVILTSFLVFTQAVSVGKYQETLLTPNGQQSRFYVNQDGKVTFLYEENCTWCTTKPNEVYIDDFEVIAKELGKTSDTIFLLDSNTVQDGRDYRDLSHMDAETFEFVGGNIGYSNSGLFKDKYAVYLSFYMRVEGADTKTFRKFDDDPLSNWYRDDNNLFYFGNLVEDADPDTFVPTSRTEGYDDKYYYDARVPRPLNCEERSCSSVNIKTGQI